MGAFMIHMLINVHR